jgi:hypothetical protein
VAFEAEDNVLRGLSAAERRELLKLLRRALGSALPQALWSAAEGNSAHRDVGSDQNSAMPGVTGISTSSGLEEPIAFFSASASSSRPLTEVEETP